MPGKPGIVAYHKMAGSTAWNFPERRMVRSHKIPKYEKMANKLKHRCKRSPKVYLYQVRSYLCVQSFGKGIVCSMIPDFLGIKNIEEIIILTAKVYY
jgi:hypothetical protein